MKLLSLELNNHPILKNFAFDFSNGGNVKDIILIVGENGCGKTIFLEEIFKIFQGNALNVGVFHNDGVSRKIKIDFSDEEVLELRLPAKCITFKSRVPLPGTGAIEIINVKDNSDISREMMPLMGVINKLFKCVYSTAEINFRSESIISVTATDIDSQKIPKIKTGQTLSREITQLLVDINSQDNAFMAEWIRANPGRSFPENTVLKFDRFKKAYGQIFDSKELKSIKQDRNFKIIFIDKNTKEEIDISGLSTGEKQVIFRVGSLLRDFKNLDGGIVLIDEPELSLHPKWQLKFMEFLGTLFEGMDVKVIIVTHSPYLLKSSLFNRIDIVTFFRGEGGILKNKRFEKNSMGDSPTISEISYLVFGVAEKEFFCELYDKFENDYGDRGKFESFLMGLDPKVRTIKCAGCRCKNGGIETLPTHVRDGLHHGKHPKHSKEYFEYSLNLLINLRQSQL